MPDTIIQKKVYFEVFCTNDSCPPLTSQQAKSNNHYEYYIIQQPNVKNTGFEMKGWVSPIMGLLGVVLGAMIISFKDSKKSKKMEDEELNNIYFGIIKVSELATGIAKIWHNSGQELRNSEKSIESLKPDILPDYKLFLLKHINKVKLEAALKSKNLIKDKTTAYDWTISVFNAFESINFYSNSLQEKQLTYEINLLQSNRDINNSIYSLINTIVDYNQQVKHLDNLNPELNIKTVNIDPEIWKKINEKQIKNKKEIIVFKIEVLLARLSEIDETLAMNENMINQPIHQSLLDKSSKIYSLVIQSKNAYNGFGIFQITVSERMQECATDLTKLIANTKLKEHVTKK
jgi:hypothetical protein